MDEAVVRAMARWPDVPDCHGWLALTRRGEWRIGTQRERIAHAGLVEFINRNYLADPSGAWFFQNGPQRVWVSLDYTPLVYRLIGDGTQSCERYVAHTGIHALHLQRVLLDESGSLILVTELGPGVLDDRDLPSALPYLRGADGRPFEDAFVDCDTKLVLGAEACAVELAQSRNLEAELGFVRNPAADSAA